MKTFSLLTFFAILLVTVMGQNSNSNDGGNSIDGNTGNSNDRCVRNGGFCSDEDDCCSPSAACTFRSYSAACRRFFRRGGDCDRSPRNACCRARQTCKKCKGRNAQCVADDDCCGDLDCNYASRTAAFADACDSHDGTNPRHLSRQLQGSVPTVKQCATNSLSFDEKFQLARSVEDWKSSHGESHRALLTSNSSDISIEIPVIFHILQYDEDVGNMNRSIITKGFIRALNKAYGETPFRFVFKRVKHTIDPMLHNCSKGMVEYSFKSQLREGDRNALNVYICNAYSSEVSGWSYYPLMANSPDAVMDGVVVQNPELYETHLASYMTLVHETGHWFGLLHTFEDGCASAEMANFTTTDDDQSIYRNLVNDGVYDTPSHAGPTDDNETCWLDAALDTCDDSIPGIDVGLDPVNNFMNYGTPDCRSLHGSFTPGQIERMVAQYYTYRAIPSNKQCRGRRKPCRANGRCCIGLTCIRDFVGQQLGRCRVCREPGSKCIRHTDCCYGECNKHKKCDSFMP
ncbi:hypothetical protein MPSEU_000869600 [Mayamaea pseudoterrestris]|nr:hypothetical protein MPSEU_000869600 [Mayamaea pseudoterrestris]